MYNALLACTKQSLNHLRKRIGTRGNLLFLKNSLFNIDLSLQVPNVVLEPSLGDIQEAINSVSRDVLQCTRQLMDWGIDATARPRSPKPFYEKLASDKNLAIELLLLTGAINETRLAAQKHLVKFDKYSWLWMDDPQTSYAEFVEKEKPILEDFIAELNRFVAVEEEIGQMNSADTMGSLMMRTENLKQQLKHEAERWKHQYSNKLHMEAKKDMDTITDHMTELTSRLEREVKDLPSLKLVMDGQAEVRDVQSGIQLKFQSIIQRYNTLETYLPPGGLGKDEMDAKSVLTKQWDHILKMSAEVANATSGLQDGFKEDLVSKVRTFKKNVKAFRADYNANGPMVKGTTPKDAMVRLSKYKREFETLSRKYELYNGGEKLFGLPEMKYPELVETTKELKLLDQLYGLYQDVITTVDEYKAIPWADVVSKVQEMAETVEGFAARCKKFPKALRKWDAFVELSKMIEEFLEILPLLQELAKDAMRPRHWEQISELTGTEFDMEKFTELKLKTVLEAKLLDFRDDI
jgi:dynein heavy chain